MSIALAASMPSTQLRANQNTGIRKKEKGKRSNCMVDRLNIMASSENKQVNLNAVTVYLAFFVYIRRAAAVGCV